MALSIRWPDGMTFDRLPRKMYEDRWCPEGSGCPMCDLERDFYDSSTSDEWHAYIMAHIEASE